MVLVVYNAVTITIKIYSTICIREEEEKKNWDDDDKLTRNINCVNYCNKQSQISLFLLFVM